MAAIVYAVPASPPTPASLARSGVVSTWTGWDGSVWDMTDSADGTFLMPGIRGLNMGPHDAYADESPAVAGSQFKDYRATNRPVFWPLAMFEDTSSQGWVDRDSAFWRTMRPGRTGVWTVQSPTGRMRSLTLRFTGDGDHTFDQDPIRCGWATYGIYLTADDPFWSAPAVTRSWRSATGADFFSGPPFTISPANTVDSASITNPGDVPRWLTWVVNGDVDSVDLGVGDSVVEVPFEVAVDQRLVIDTSPTGQVALLGDPDPDDPFGVLNGEDVTGDLGAVDFVQVDADATTELTIDMTGTGSISARLVPGYWRAW